DAPPRLHRGDEKPAEPAAEKASTDKASTEKAPTSTPTSTASAPPAEKTPTAPASTAKPPESMKAAEPVKSAESASIEDPNRPILRRGKPDPAARRELVKNFDEDSTTKFVKSGGGKDALNGVQIIPAISDAAGPDARSYAYETKP